MVKGSHNAERKGRWPWAILLLLLMVLAVNGIGITWGLPSHYSWAPDSVHPYLVLNAMDHAFSGGWFDKYPPFHYMLTAAVFYPALKACDPEEIRSIREDKDRFYENPHVQQNLLKSEVNRETLSRFFLLGRALNAVMGTLICLAVYLAGKEIFDARAGFMAALIAAFHPITVFYSHTMNTEVPYFMWAAFGMYCFIRALKRQDLFAYLGLGVFAALATATKEQAFGLFAFLPPVLVYARAAHGAAGRPGPGALVRALWDGKIVAGALAFVAATVLANNLIFNFKGYMDHLAFNAPGVSVLERIHPLTLQGCWNLTVEMVTWVYRTSTLPVFLLCMLGMIGALWKTRKAAFVVLLPALSYFLVFIVYIGFLTPRYITPIFFQLALFGGKFLADFVDGQRLHRVIRYGAAGVFAAYLFVLGAGIDLLFITDPRYKAEAWMEHEIPEGSRVLPFSSPFASICRLPPGRQYFPVQRFEGLMEIPKLTRQANPDFLVVQVFHSNVAGSDPKIWLPRFEMRFDHEGFEIVETMQPFWPHPALSYLFINPYVIMAKKNQGR